jgi:hypothetical protein
MAFQASGPISWSALNLAYGNTSNASLSISSIRNSTAGVGVSNVSMSNFQNACIPLNGTCMNRYIVMSGGSFMNDAASGQTMFGNSNGTISYVTSITVPGGDNFGNEWTGLFKIPAGGQNIFQIATDDGGELALNETIIATHYGSHGAYPAGTAATTNNPAGVYRFRFRQQEVGGGEAAFIAYTNSGTAPTPDATTNAAFMSNVCYNYRPIIKLDANDIFFRQGQAVNSAIATWSNNGTDGTLRHAVGSNSPTLTSDANGYMVSFNRASSQHFSIGNLEFDQFRSTDGTPINKNGLTIFIVARMPTTNAGASERLFDFGTGQGANNIIVFRASATNNIAIAILTGSTNNGQVVFNNAFDGGFHVYTVVIQNGTSVTISLSVDNQAITYGITNDVTPNANIGNRTTTLNYIGRSNWGIVDAYLTGDIRELLVFREVIDNTTISRMNNYLMYKWGIRAFMPPVTSGMIGLYTGESWTGSQWTDLSGSGNHATTSTGTISTTSLNSLTALAGGTTAGIRFPSTILPSTYTLFHVARYNGASRGRIIDGFGGPNWLSGFHSNKSGVAYHGDAGSWVTAINDLHGNAWVLSTDQRNLYRSQRVNRTVANYTAGVSSQISIGMGNWTGENSDWACACVVVYNRELTTNEILQVEAFLARRYNL